MLDDCYWCGRYEMIVARAGTVGICEPCLPDFKDHANEMVRMLDGLAIRQTVQDLNRFHNERRD